MNLYFQMIIQDDGNSNITKFGKFFKILLINYFNKKNYGLKR